MFDLIKRNLLRITMLVDGAVSLVAGAGLAALAVPATSVIGPAFSATALVGIGIYLVLSGIFNLQAGRAEAISPTAVRLAVVGDALWVAISATILVIEWQGLTVIGVAAIAVLAVMVADILLLKLIGLRGLASAAHA